MSTDSTTPESPAVVNADAKDRAWRTLLQGLAIDVLAAVFIVLAPLLSNIEWTPEYWKALGVLVAKSAVQAVAAYIMRKMVRPKEA